MKYLIINADDLGYSRERNNGIVECLKKGIVTNTSLLVNGFEAEHAVKLCSQIGLSVSVGM